MPYFDWQHLVKPLTWSPVQQDTTENTKALSFAPVADVHSDLVNIQIPGCSFTPYFNQGGAPNPIVPLIVGQICFSVNSAFSLIKYGADVFLNTIQIGRCAICVRFRVGNTVTRYKLYEDLTYYYDSRFVPVPAPWYTGQTIQPNFVIEIWQSMSYPGGGINVVVRPTLLNTGIIYIPTDENDSGPVIGSAATIDYTALESSLPETLPTAVAANGPWLTN